MSAVKHYLLSFCFLFLFGLSAYGQPKNFSLTNVDSICEDNFKQIANYSQNENEKQLEKEQAAIDSVAHHDLRKAVVSLDNAVEGIKAYRQRHPEDHSAFYIESRLKSELGDCYFMLNDYNRAEAIYSELLNALVKDALSKASGYYSGINDNNFTYSIPMGSEDSNAKRYLQIAAILRPSSWPPLGNILHNLAFIYEIKGNFAYADELYKLALILSPPPGDGFFYSAKTAWQFPCCLPCINNKYNESFVLIKKKFGTQHPFVATRLSLLARYTYGAKGCKFAEPLYREAIDIQLRHPKDTCQELLMLELRELRYCLCQQHKDTKFTDRKILEVSTRLFGSDSANALQAKFDLANDLAKAHKDNEYNQLRKQISDIMAQQNVSCKNPESPYALWCRDTESNYLIKRNYYDPAKNALNLFLTRQYGWGAGPDPSDIITLEMLADALVKSKDYRQAEKALEIASSLERSKSWVLYFSRMSGSKNELKEFHAYEDRFREIVQKPH